MAHSLSRTMNVPSGKLRHALSHSEFTIRNTPAGIYQTLKRGGFSAEHRVAYVIGSGNHGLVFLIDVGGYLFQSPVAYYSKRRIWGMAPGFEADRSPDFTRPVTAECLWCHAGRPLPVPETLNQYQQPAFAAEPISCDRCHGPAEAHLKQPSARNIINPARLPARARDSVCEQCHLGGEARIPNPGKQIGEFQPGQDLEEVFSVYVFEAPAQAGLRVVSHAQQLARSTCAIKSGARMWCGACHNPHEKPDNRQLYYRAKCLSCHGGTLASTHSTPAEDCTGCHMPQRPARDGGHTVFTDHQIARRPQEMKPLNQQAPRLAPWREPPASVALRNLALAYSSVGERDRSAMYMDEAFRLLSQARKSFPNDPPVLTSLGLVTLRRGRTKEAASLFEQALQADPGYAPYYVNLATAYKEQGRLQEAIIYLEKAIALDPSLQPAYRELGEIYRGVRQPAKLRQVFERYLKFMPNSITARIGLGAP